MTNTTSEAKKILIVDDEPTLVFFLKQGLQESDLRCCVDNASSSQEALSKLTLERYELLITDLRMPGISGLTLIEVARSLYPNIHVILMTAYGSRDVEEKASQLRVDAYLTKPFPTAKLRDVVSKLLTNSSPIKTPGVSEPQYKG
jgi:YesN/AraC family two-component response regulator